MSFTGKQLIGTYILGGILGGAVYMLSYNYIPYFEGKIALLSGASASIMAIIVATALDMPNMPIRLLLVGSVKLKWLAVVTVLISVLGITSNNSGGEIAHIGGALAGWLWFVLLKRNINIIKPINYTISAIVNIFSSKPRLKKNRRRARYHYVKSDEQYNMEQKQNNRNLDAILDKIRRSGYNSLTEDEKKQLFDISRKI
jgi:rhomboid family protein